MRRSLPALMVLGLLLASCPASGQGLDGPSWEMGWVTDVDPKYVVELEDDWDLSGELVVFVNNDGPAELNLALTYDYDEDGPFTFDGPESVSVSGNTNDTFTIKITGGTAEEVGSICFALHPRRHQGSGAHFLSGHGRRPRLDRLRRA